MKPDVGAHVAAVRAALETHGLLLAHDAKLPSVTTIVTGGPVKGSWWGHPQGNEIFHTLGAIEDEVGWAKLINAKVTLVHPRLFPALAGAAGAEAAWQTEGLAAAALALLARVRVDGALRADELDKPTRAHVAHLERRILVATRDEHTDAGHHTKILEPWDRWAKARSVKPLADATARRALETAAATLGPGARLPWAR